MNSPEHFQQQNNLETSIEINEPLGLKEPIIEFLKSKGMDESFVPVIKTNNSGILSVEILKDGKGVFNGYSTAIPFNIGKEKIIEGAKEAIGYWIDSQLPVMEDMNTIKEDIKKQLEMVKRDVNNQN